MSLCSYIGFLLLLLQNDKDRRHTFASLALRKRYSYLADPASSESYIFFVLETSAWHNHTCHTYIGIWYRHIYEGTIISYLTIFKNRTASVSCLCTLVINNYICLLAFCNFSFFVVCCFFHCLTFYMICYHIVYTGCVLPGVFLNKPIIMFYCYLLYYFQKNMLVLLTVLVIAHDKKPWNLISIFYHLPFLFIYLGCFFCNLLKLPCNWSDL